VRVTCQRHGQRARRTRGGDHLVAVGHRQHIAGLVSLQVRAQARVGAIHFIAGDPAASSARAIMARASFGLVANAVLAGIPAAAHRALSEVQDLGRYNSWSISAWRVTPGQRQIPCYW
jgi:hypothetical protein